LLAAAIFALGFALTFFAARGLVRNLRDNAAAQEEYAHLRSLSIVIATVPRPAPAEPSVVPPESPTTEPEVYPDPDYSPALTPEQIAASLSIFAEINPNFVGWITIAGTTVDYPIVRGPNNARYLNTTFSGASNPAGAIFMDYRCTGGFDAPVCIIYGHNMRDGTMFSSLMNFLDRDFGYSEIIIVTADGEILVYHVFAVRRTDAWDSVYALDFNDAKAASAFFGDEDTERFLVLSTCLTGADRHARLLVFAALVED